MKSFAAITALFAAGAMAQSIADLPSCSLSCLLTGLASVGCTVSDFACACGKSAQLSSSVTPCVQSACTSPADQAKVITVLEGICLSAGFTITLSPPAATSAAPAPSSSAAAATSAAPEPSSSAAAASSSAAASSAAPVSSSAAAASSSAAVSSLSSAIVTPSSVSSGVYPTGGSNSSVTTASPTAFTGAASANGVTFGAAGILGLAAYFL